MNIFKFLFINKSKIKMEKLHALIALAMFYSNFKDEARMKIAIEVLNKEAETLGVKVIAPKLEVKQDITPKLEVKQDTAKPENKPDVKHQDYKNTQAKINAEKQNKDATDKAAAEKQSIVARLQKESDDAAAKVKAVADKAEADKLSETLIEVYPFEECAVNTGKHDKRINVSAPRKFKVFKTEADQAQANNAYPTEEEFFMVIDEAWGMASAGKSNKEIVAMLRKELGEFYPELKADSDYYAKLVNPLVASVGFIKAAFGYKATDATVTVTRPSTKGIVLTREFDVMVAGKSNVEEKKPENKPDMKTVQTGKVTEKAVVIKDEEIQEKETEEEVEEEEVEETTVEVENPTERDTTKPPVVNKFADFNNLETLVFEKYLEGATLAISIKDENGKKAVLAEKREDCRMLIASNFEDEPWTEKGTDGKWNPRLIDYHNGIVSQITANKANWPK